jgi:hypothetical protein
MKWYDISPEDAVDIDCRNRPDLDPPLTEFGEVCPWPWDSQQLAGQPIGMYHCPYCGDMQVAGVRHLDARDIDYTEVTEPPPVV